MTAIENCTASCLFLSPLLNSGRLNPEDLGEKDLGKKNSKVAEHWAFKAFNKS